MSDTPEVNGGTGGIFKIPLKSVTDLRLEQRAVRQRWNIPEEHRQEVIDRQIAIARDPASSAKEASIAARVLVSMDEQNMEQERRDQALPEFREVIDQVTEEDRRQAVAEFRDMFADFPEARARVSERVYQKLQERRAQEANGRREGV